MAVRWIVVATLLLASCGGGVALDDAAIADLRESTDELDEYTDSQLRTVATSLCDALAGDSESTSDGAVDAAWSEAEVDDVGVDEILAALAIIDSACPEALTPEVAADNEPISMSFTLVGDEGDEYTYSAISGCQGEGGYGDIREGMLFNLTDAQGDVLGVARLDDSEETSLGCELSGAFPVTFGELDDETLYIVGDRAGRRGEIAYTGTELVQQGEIALSLG